MTTLRRIALCVALVLVGCGHGMDGPTPTITKIVPSVACNQLDTTVLVTGTGFVPVPEKTLQKMSVLILPTVTLVDASGNKTAIDPASVTWTDETSMTFIVHASLNLAPGVYDVVVTNPTGKSATAHGALTIVPPPMLISIKPTEVCDMRTTQVTLTGMSFRDDPQTAPLLVTIGTPTPTVLSEADGAVVFVDPQTVTVNLPSGLPDGVWSVTIQNADGCSSTLDNALTVAPPPTITSVVPSSAWNGQDTTVTITGTGFRDTPTVAIAAAGGTSIMLAATFVDAEHVTAVVPKGTAAGSYTLTVTNPDGCSATAMLTVTSTPPITVTGVINPFGCSSDGTPITITGTFFESTPQAYLVGAATGGGDLKLVNVAFVSSTKLTAIVPSGGVIGGPYALEVVNPDGGTGQLAAAFTITDLCPPEIDDVSPNSVVHDYNTMATGSTPITVTGSNFRADAKVVLVNQSGQEVALPNVSVDVSGIPTKLTVNFNASSMNLTDGIYLVRVKEADAAPTAGTGATMWGDYSLFIVTNPSGKFQPAMAGKPLPAGRRGLGVVGGQVNAAARFIYAVAGDSGGATPTLFDDGLVAALDLFGNVGDAGWLALRKMATAPATGDTKNTLPSARTGVGVAQWNGWVYVIGGTTSLGAAGLGATFTPTAPLTDVRKARILPASEAPTVTATAGTGGTLAAGTYYYKVSTLVTAGTAGYGANAAETVASDEQVVTVAATGSVQLAFTRSSSIPAANVAGFRIYRSAAANGTSQSEVFLADVGAAATSYTDDGSATPGMAHPLSAGMLSEWEAGPALQVARAYPGVTVAVAEPTAGTTIPYLYVVGGASSASVVERTYEVSSLASGNAGAFGPALTGSNDCTSEKCMATGRWSLFAAAVVDPPSVTNPVTNWIVAGAGATTAGQSIDEHAQITGASGLLQTWSAVTTDASAAFTISPESLGPLGFYSNAHLAIIDGYAGLVQNKDEFVGLLCNGTSTNGVCDAGVDFKQAGARSNSNLGVMPPIAWSGYAITSGYMFIVGGSTDGTNAVTTVQQGAQ